MQPKRNLEIDILRGIGILAIILIHVNAYFLGDPLAKTLWNYSEFAVQTFVLISAYIFFKKKTLISLKDFVSYLKKRLVRLVLPYWVFLIFYFLLIAIFDRQDLIFSNIIRQITLTTTGNELNWFVLLFLQFTFLIPLLSYWAQKRKVFFSLYVLAAFSSSLLLISYNPGLNFKLFMWLPWSLIVVFTWYVAAYEEKKWFYPTAIFATGSVYFFLSRLLTTIGRSLLFYDEKYPPNLYLLNYGIFATLILFWLIKKGLFDLGFLRKSLIFLGIHSYSIFFIHFFLVVGFNFWFGLGHLLWWQMFLIVLSMTLLIQTAINKFLLYLRR